MAGRGSAELCYEEGQRLEKLNRFEKAIEHFQKSLACIPNYLGITTAFMSYLLDGVQPPPYGQDFVAQIYEALSRCLYRLQRIEDASICAKAALRLKPTSVSAWELYRQVQKSRRKTSDEICLAMESSESASHINVPNIKNKLTILMVTHYTEKLKINTHLSPPLTGLVEKTYSTLVYKFGQDIHDCRKILCFDRRSPSDLKQSDYQNKLKNFAAQYGFEMKVMPGWGLLKIMEQIAADVKTPYLMFLEHDWEFQYTKIELSRLLDLFDQFTGLNYVKFNKRDNIINRWDFYLEKERHIPGVDLTRAMAYSNNPHILRVAKLRNEWLPLCLKDVLNKNLKLTGTAMGIEEPLFKHQLKDIRRFGFTNAHARWGTYIYGKLGDPAQVRHLGI